MLISVIVPVYNVEKYLRHCIDSILVQTFTDFELILVDDGSPDGCGKICDDYALKDSRIQVIHQENSGVSVARNAGLRLAKGEYITFCDSDDYCGQLWLEHLVSAANTYKADLVLAGYSVVDEFCAKIRDHHRSVGKWNLNSEKDIIEYITNNILVDGNGWEVCTTLFRSDIINSHHISFCESCENYAEDLGFMLEYILFCKTSCAIAECDYFYVKHEGSMMDRSRNIAKLNSMNEIAVQFGKRYFETIKTIRYRKMYTVFYYWLISHQYSNISQYGEYLKNSIKTIETIKNITWHDKWLRRIVFFYPYLKKFYGDEETKIRILNTRLFVHRNWRRFEIESAITYKLFIRK